MQWDINSYPAIHSFPNTMQLCLTAKSEFCLASSNYEVHSLRRSSVYSCSVNSSLHSCHMTNDHFDDREQTFYQLLLFVVVDLLLQNEAEDTK